MVNRLTNEGLEALVGMQNTGAELLSSLDFSVSLISLDLNTLVFMPIEVEVLLLVFDVVQLLGVSLAYLYSNYVPPRHKVPFAVSF